MTSKQDCHNGAAEKIVPLAQSHGGSSAVDNTTGAASASEKRVFLYHYEINENYHVFEWANIIVERSGPIHPAASFALRGVVRMDPPGSRNLLVTAVGDTAMGQVASRITFRAEATVTQDGNVIDKKTLSASSHGYILPYPDPSFTIGEAKFTLPDPSDNTQIMVHVEGSYTAQFDEGNAVPGKYMARLMPAIAKKSFIIEKVMGWQW